MATEIKALGEIDHAVLVFGILKELILHFERRIEDSPILAASVRC